ncbi:MAG: DUF5693 family protein [Peptococcales bacterium]
MNILTKKNITTISYILIGLALILSFYLVFQRVNIEKDYDQVEIMLNLTEVQSLANANNLSFSEMLFKLKEHHATGILIKELSLGDLARTGKVQFFQGEEIKHAPYYAKLSKDIDLNDANILVSILDKAQEDQITTHLREKISGIKIYQDELTVAAIPVNLPNSDKEKELIYEELKAIGVGFNKHTLDEIAAKGLNIIPQVRDWPKPTDKSIEFMAEEIKKIPNLSLILFNDKQVPGYPDKMGVWVKKLKDVDNKVHAPVGMVEFFNQKGVAQFATLLNKEIVRVHSIAVNEMNTYTPQSAIERYELAVSERNIRSLFIRFFNMSEPSTGLEKNLKYLSDLKTTLENEGFQIGQAKQFKSPTYSRIIIGFIGLGVIAGGVLLLLHKKWLKLAVILGLLGVIAWGGLLLKNPILARKLMALASVVIYPTLSFLIFTREKPRSIAQSIFALVKMSAVSLVGAVLMVGMLADKLFMLKLDQFVGVKAAHVFPLVLVPLLIFILSDNPLKTVKKLLDQAITYRYAILAGLVAVALAIYVIRTGNEGTALVSGIEEKIRAGLKDILGVRPRTKEFLIGHPFTLLILYLGLNRKNWFLVLPAIIGQVSLVNTYAHIHTPIIISLIRSINGLWIGILLGIVLIIAVKLLGKYLNYYCHCER